MNNVLADSNQGLTLSSSLRGAIKVNKYRILQGVLVDLCLTIAVEVPKRPSFRMLEAIGESRIA